LRTFGACRRAWPGHHRFVDGDPLKGGDEQCREVDAGLTVSRTVAATAGGSRLKYGGGFPLLQRPLVDRLRVSVGEGVGGAANLVSRAPAPHPLFILALCSGGPPTIKGWAPPIRARIKALIDRWVY